MDGKDKNKDVFLDCPTCERPLLVKKFYYEVSLFRTNGRNCQ